MAVVHLSQSSPAEVPLSIYIHTPWCEKKCPYCDFNSHAYAGVKQGGIPESLEQQYLTALQQDLATTLQSYPHLGQRELVSIFIGGGTPSLLSSNFYADLFATINQEFVINDKTEITLEANPSSAEYNKFAAYRGLGINRISLGVQSFSNDKLAVLGRVHKAEDATQAYNAAVAAGFKRINLDIMFGLPHQSLEEAMADVQLATATGVGHISRYQLTLEPNTLFAAKPPAGLPDEDALVEMEEEGGAWLRQQGFRPYEVSAWVRDGGGDDRQANGVVDSPALHNLNYWQFGDYIGLGAGAHSKITLPPVGGNVSEAGHRVYRARRPRSPDKYISSPHSYSRSSEIIAGSGHLTAGELVYEFMLNALRLVDGFPLALFSDRTGLDAAIIQAEIGRGEELGLLVRDGGRLKPTQRGRQLTDDAILLFSDKA